MHVQPKRHLVSAAAASCCLSAATLFLSGCAVGRATGDTVESVGVGVGQMLGGISSGLGHMIAGTGRAVSRASVNPGGRTYRHANYTPKDPYYEYDQY